ncbi:MAG: endopeptidase La [Planctomycetota bacterium]
MSDDKPTNADQTNGKVITPAKAAEGPPQGPNGEPPEIPDALPVLPVRNMVLFPDMILPLVLKNERDVALVDAVLLEDRLLAVVPQTDGDEDAPVPEDLHGTGCAGMVLRMLKFPDGTTRLLVQGLARVRLGQVQQKDPFFRAGVEELDEVRPAEKDKDAKVRIDALFRSLRDRFQEFANTAPNFPEEVKVAGMNISDPGRLADLVSAHVNLSLKERCEILDAIDIRERLERLSVLLGRELQVVELGRKIQSDVQEKVGKGQREFFLREQLKSIKRELGEEDEGQADLEELKRLLDEADLPEVARKEADRELKRIADMPPSSAEYTVSRTYLDWMAHLPWAKRTEDHLDVQRAREILDSEHYGLEKVKDRILEYLAVRKINPEGRGPILCFAGPPGVGKTSLGRSIAESLGREFVRISLGGVRDEAEIRGHRRTYIGALPGRILQGLRKAGTRNPVFMMDEIDKLASDFRGDPASALLEVLDPEQNDSFTDHYLDVPFDLSSVMFITTANQTDTIPPALRDRMEILRLPGYAEEEKVEIARKHLARRVLSEHGLTTRQLRFTKAGLRTVIGDYTREAGLRNLEREMATVCRKVAVRVAEGKKTAVRLTAGNAREYLGPPRRHVEAANRTKTPGVAIGLAWTPTGGDVLFVESTRMEGKGQLILTGKLGDVMKESATAALSWIRTHAHDLGLLNGRPPRSGREAGSVKDEQTTPDAEETQARDLFATSDFHVHVPEGAIPKDGPSAGVTLIVSLVSLLAGRPVPPKLAMTGELSLRGRVLPVGGIKEKLLAARRAGITDVILPRQNENDLDDLPQTLRKALTVHPVETTEEVLAIAFPKGAGSPTGTKKPKRGTSGGSSGKKTKSRRNASRTKR